MPRVMRALPNATVVCDKRCVTALSQHFDTSAWKFQVVAEGETLSLGKRTLQFVETPMVHWPESMFTYVPEEKLLFSMDAFGQHFATAERFDDDASLYAIMEQAKAYYANIVMPYGKSVVACLKKAEGLPIEMIAPSHGVIWRSRVAEIVRKYQDWSLCRPKPKVAVIYDSMWGSTEKMAQAILEGASLPGVAARLIHIRRSNLTRIATEMVDTAGVAFGSSTLNRSMMPMAAAVLAYLGGLRPTNKASFAFGSFGWGRGATEAIDESLRAMNWDLLRDPLKCQFRPTPEALDECREAGKTLAERALQMAAEAAV
ncbi:MAG TPA: FprA family A-type flavoprotein, partial [Thermoguttaceae bacterium]|nr:FprA family A-type flavoprotein [Thermoguttaceae bacterium]